MMGSDWLEPYSVEMDFEDGLWYIWYEPLYPDAAAGPYHSKREAEDDVIAVATRHLEDME